MSSALPTTDFAFQAPPIPLPQAEAPTPKRWTRDQYYRLDELGYFENQRVELIDGEILVVSPQSFGHYWSMDTIAELLREVFNEGYWVRMQGPCHPDVWSEPEPDVSVIKGKKQDFKDHPASANLVVEVSKTTLSFDRGKKQYLYAAMNVSDYWILDLAGRQLLVHREPITDESAPLGHRYNSVETIPHDGTVAPLEKPKAKLAVADMLPPVEKMEDERVEK